MFRNRYLIAFAAILFCFTAAVAGQTTSGKGHYPTGGLNLSGPLPMDVGGVTWQVCGGVGAVTRKWMTGPLFDVIDHSGNTVTIFAKNGYPDVRKLAGLMGVSITTGISGLLSPKVYDQCGGAQNWTQATTANQPAIWLINGKVYIFMGGVLSTQIGAGLSNQFYAFPGSAVPSNTQSASIYAALNPYTTSASTELSNSAAAPTIINSDNIYTWGPGLGFTFAGGNPPNAGVFDFTSFAGPVVSGNQLTIQQMLMSFVLGPSSSAVCINETCTSQAQLTAGTGHYQFWGNTNGAPVPSGLGARQLGIAVSTQILNSTQQSQVRSAFYKWANIHPLPSAGFVNLVIDGASIDEGQGGDPTGLYLTQNGGGYGWAEMIKDYLAQRGYAVQFNNAAVSGNTIQQSGVAYAATTHNLFNPAAKKNIYFGFNSCIGNTLNFQGSGAFTASIAGTVMTVTGSPVIPLQVAQNITVPGGTNTTIVSFGTGTGGAGTYNVANSQTIGSESMTATNNGTSAYNDFLAALALVKAQSWNVIVTYLFQTTDPQNTIYNNLMITNAATNGVQIIQQYTSNNPSHNPDVHPTVIGYQGYYGNFIGPLLPMLFNYLLERDLGGPANDNRPVGINQAA